MKILVLGNGFDLDHNLPTSYMDFLNFCNCVLDVDNPDSPTFLKLKPAQVRYIESLRECEAMKNTFYPLLENNHLLNYFNKRIEKQGENWIDFEFEIKSIASEFKLLEFEYKQSNQSIYSTDINHKAYQILVDLGLGSLSGKPWDEPTLSAIHNDLCLSLNNFSKALEFYVSVFINETDIDGVSPDIIDFDANKVITFNYSNTYERLYGGVRWDESIDHVHGTALTKPTNNARIILGITSDDIHLQNYYVEFEKYFQRITKKTGNEYKKWIQARLGTNEKIEVMFFGHSLDSTDSDIVKDLVCNENSVISIYYFDEKAHQQIVGNLIEILGKNILIDYVSGLNPKIKFIEQRKHRVENTAGIEITRDIRRMYKLYSMNDLSINELLLKIQSKVYTQNTSYFYSQKKAISLFEALKYYNVDFAVQEDFFAICEKLDFEKDKYGKLLIYDVEEWYDHAPWGEEIPCEKETVSLIKAVNKSNKKRFQKKEKSKFYSKILTMETSEEIKLALIEIFNEKFPTEAYWEQLNELISIMHKNSLFETALDLIKSDDLPLAVSAKAKHFDSLYDEYCFNIDYAKQMAEAYQYDEEY